MAEIKDVYSLEFNSSQFQSEITSAIGRIEELNAAMEEGADVADQLAEAQGSLVDILGTEAKGIEQLNQKRNVLVNTTKQLNNESKAGVAVGKQLDATNKQIAVSTGNAVKQQKSFGATLLQGTRSIGQMRRVLSTLQFAFRAVAAAVPFGLILSFAGPVLNFFSSLFKKTDENAVAMEKLNDKTLGYGERLDIIKGELERLEQVEQRRGYLTEEEKKQREELTQKYQETADQIVKIEQERFQRIQDLQDQANRIRVKLLGDTVQAAEQNYKTELSILGRELNKQFREIEKFERETRESRSLSESDKNRLLQQAADERAQLLETYSLQEQQLERDKNEAINRIAEQARKEREQREKEEREKIGQAIIDEFNMRKAFFEELERREKELAEERERLRQASLDGIRAEMKAYDESLQTLKNNLDAASQYRVNIAEDNLNFALLNLEKERNAELLAAFGNTEAQAEIDKEYNAKRAEFEKIANQEIIRIRIEFLKKLRDASADDPGALASLNKQISDLELQFEQLNKTVSEDVEKTKDKYKELAEQAGQVVQLASDTVFQVLNAQVTGYIDNLDRAVDRSKTALDDIRQNSENFNARQLEIEKERLERLEAERARAVEREKNLGQIQVAINAAIAISKAAAEGGGFASAFTIAATLASLIAGLAQARAAAGNAFFHGVEYLERGNNPRGRDTIPAMLNEGERVITTDTNNKYWDVLSAVHNNRIPADILNSFANAYQQGGLRAALGAFGDNISLAGELGQKSVFVNVAQNYAGMENRLERIEQVLTELPKYMPKTVVQANAKGIFRIVEQRQQRKDFSRNWAK